MFYAAYGSNLHPFRLSQRLPESRYQGTAEIAGRRLCFHKRSKDRSGKCNIVAGTGSVHVAVYDLDGRERAELDRIEGVGSGYEVKRIEAPGFGDCFTYIATASFIDDELRPYSWYKELVLVGCETLGLPIDYVSTIRAVVAIEDPDQARHDENMRIVEQARKPASALPIK